YASRTPDQSSLKLKGRCPASVSLDCSRSLATLRLVLAMQQRLLLGQFTHRGFTVGVERDFVVVLTNIPAAGATDNRSVSFSESACMLTKIIMIFDRRLDPTIGRQLNPHFF